MYEVKTISVNELLLLYNNHNKYIVKCNELLL